MYLDKLYTKLYSEHNWKGLQQLVSEIRVFACADSNNNKPAKKDKGKYISKEDQERSIIEERKKKWMSKHQGKKGCC